MKKLPESCLPSAESSNRSAYYHACWFAHDSTPFREEVAAYFNLVSSGSNRLLIICAEDKIPFYSELLNERSVRLENVEVAPIDEVLDDTLAIDPEEFVERLREVRAEVLKEGREHLYVFVDMDWIAGQRTCVHQVASLCTRIDTILQEEGASVLSYYERSLFSPTRLLDLLPLYSHVFARGKVVESNYYAAAENRLKRHRHEAVLDHVLSTIKGFDETTAFYTGPPVDAESTLQLLRAIIDSMGDGVLVVDRDGKLVLFNKAGKSIIGYDYSELPLEERARKFGNYLPDKVTRYPVEDLPISRAMRGESVNQVEIFIKNKKKPEGVWTSNTGRPLVGRNGEARGAVLVFRDITQSKRAASQRRELEGRILQKQKLESLGLLAGGVAHDFNNLLLGILANSSLAQRQAVDDEQKSCLADITKTAERLSDLTKQLLDYSGRKTSNADRVDINGLVEELRGLLRPVLSSKAKVKCNFDRKRLAGEFDSTQVRQVLMNLLTNASDALEGKAGVIEISTGSRWLSRNKLAPVYLGEYLKEGEFAFVSVKDSGCGIAEDTLKRIFDPFFTTKVTGRGLGLAAVLGLVKANRGGLAIESSTGVGTTFTLFLPVAELGKRTVEPVVEKPIEPAHGRVLVIDDEEVVRDVTRKVLEHSGYEVVTAASGKEGVELFKSLSDSIDAVLLDLTMPDMSGKQVFDRVKSFAPDVRVILSSGFSEGGASSEFRGGKPPAGFLQKPYVPDMLISKIKEVLK